MKMLSINIVFMKIIQNLLEKISCLFYLIGKSLRQYCAIIITKLKSVTVYNRFLNMHINCQEK